MLRPNLVHIRPYVSAIYSAPLCALPGFLDGGIRDVETDALIGAQVLQRQQFDAVVAAKMRHIFAFDPHPPEMGDLDIVQAHKAGLLKGRVPFRSGRCLVSGHDFVPCFSVGFRVFLQGRLCAQDSSFSARRNASSRRLFS